MDHKPLYNLHHFTVRFYAPDVTISEEQYEDPSYLESIELPPLSEPPAAVSIYNRQSFFRLNNNRLIAREKIATTSDWNFDYRPITTVKSSDNYYDIQTFWEKYLNFATPGVGAPNEVTLSVNFAKNDVSGDPAYY